MVRLVLFDIDGTLIHTRGAGVEAFARAFQTEFGIVDGARGMRFAGRTDTSLAREMFERNHLEATPARFDRFFNAYVFWLDHLLSDGRGGGLCVGVERFLADLAQLDPPPVIGLLTGNVRLGAEIKLRRFNLWHRFRTGAFGDDHEDRNQIAVIAQQRGNQLLGRSLRGDETVVVGDTPHDIRCGRAIGARVLAVATGGAKLEELQCLQPDWAVAHLDETPATMVCS